MQVCSILGGQRYSRKLNEYQVTSILKKACERPPQREGSILEVIFVTTIPLLTLFLYIGSVLVH